MPVPVPNEQYSIKFFLKFISDFFASIFSGFLSAISGILKKTVAVAAESKTEETEREMVEIKPDFSVQHTESDFDLNKFVADTEFISDKKKSPQTEVPVTDVAALESQQEKLEIYFDVNDYKIYIMEPGGRRELPMMYYYNTFKDTPEAVPYLALALGKEKGIINTDATPENPYTSYEDLVALLNDKSGPCTLFGIIDTNGTQETRPNAVAVVQKIPAAVQACIEAKEKGEQYIPLNEAAKAQIQQSKAAIMV